MDDNGYGVVIKYYYFGLILAMAVYRFILGDLFTVEGVLAIPSVILFGTAIGSFVILTRYGQKRNAIIDKKMFSVLQRSGRFTLTVKNIIYFSVVFIIGRLLSNMSDLLFKPEVTIDTVMMPENVKSYIAVVIASSIFAIIYTIGQTKRLEYLNGAQKI